MIYDTPTFNLFKAIVVTQPLLDTKEILYIKKNTGNTNVIKYSKFNDLTDNSLVTLYFEPIYCAMLEWRDTP